jgi:hypothetical protein
VVGEDGEGHEDFGVDEFAFVLLLEEPEGEDVDWDGVDGDVFSVYASSLSCFLDIFGNVDLGPFVCEAGGAADRGAEGDEGRGVVSGFFVEFPSGGSSFVFGAEVSAEACGEFDDVAVDGDSELFDEDEFSLCGEGEDGDDSVAVWPLGVLPRVFLDEAKEAAGEERCGF